MENDIEACGKTSATAFPLDWAMWHQGIGYALYLEAIALNTAGFFDQITLAEATGVDIGTVAPVVHEESCLRQANRSPVHLSSDDWITEHR